jgi:hypothetical protein
MDNMSGGMPGFIEHGQGAAQGTTDADAHDAELIKRARELGWRSKEEYRGPEDRWVAPEEFVRRGEEVLPIVKSQLERERERVAALERQMNEQQRLVDERLKKAHETWEQRLAAQQAEADAKAENTARIARLAIQRQRDRFMADLDAAKRAVVPEDVRQHYDTLVEQEREFYKSVTAEEEQFNHKPKPAPAQEQKPQGAEAPRQLRPEELETINAWRAQNKWFDDKPDARRLADIIHVNLLEERPTLSLRENLDLVAQEMNRRFPEKTGYVAQQQQYQASQQREFYGNNGNGGQQSYQNNGQQQSYSNGSGQQQSYQGNDQRQEQRQHSSVEGGQSYNNSSSGSAKKGWGQIHPNDRKTFETIVFPTGIYGKDFSKAKDLWAADYHDAYAE